MRRLSAAANAEVLLLRNSKRGRAVQPQDIVEYAADEGTALHSVFEWDDTEAGRLFRLEQARGVLRVTVEVVREHPSEPIRAFVSLSSDRGTGGGYRRLRDVMNDEQLRAELLQDALADMRLYREKYSDLQELTKVWAAVEEVEKSSKTAASRRNRGSDARG